MSDRLKQNLHWILLGFLLLLFIIYSFVSTGYYGGTDNVAHYLFSHFAFRHPEHFLNTWARPMYTIFSSPFAQFGMQGLKLYNILTGIATAYFCFRIAGMLGFRHPLAAIILVLFTPLYFIMLPTALTEIIFSFIFVLSLFFFLRKNYLMAAIVMSFLPFARSEGFIMLPLFMFVLFVYKQYRAIPFLVSGLVIFSIIGSFYHHDLFWVFTKFPYPVSGHHPIYTEKGSLWHFIQSRNSIIGLPLELLFLAGIAVTGIECFARDPLVRRRAVLLGLLALAPFLLYLAFHSVLYWKALGGSMGLGRVMAAMLPLAALVCLKGYEGLEQIFRFSVIAQRIFLALVLAVVVVTTLLSFPIPYTPGPEEATIQRVSDWYKKSPYAGRKPYFTDISTSMQLGLDYFETKNPDCYLLKDCRYLDTIPPNSILIWDAHFGSNESQIPPDSMLRRTHFRLIRYFRPTENWITFGGYPYECYVMKVLQPGQHADNYAIRDSLIEADENNSAVKNILFNTFEPAPGSDTSMLSRDFAFSGLHSFKMDEKTEFSPGAWLLVSTLPKNTGMNGIRAVAYVYLTAVDREANTLMVISFEHKNQSYSYTSMNINQQKLKPGQWNRISLTARLPGFKSPDDCMKFYIWNPGKQVFYMDNLKVDLVKMP